MSVLNAESEYELEAGFEAESSVTRDSELLFNSLAAMADRGGSSQALRRVALNAARAALRGATTRAPVIEGELEWAGLVHESTATTLQELEAELEHLAHAAAEAESEQEAAEQFLPLIPLAAKLALPLVKRALPGAARALARSAPSALRRLSPGLSRGVSRVTRTLYQNPTTRPLVRAVPDIASRTLQSITSRLARGQRITPLRAAQILAQQTTRTLGHPGRLHRCLRHSVRADRRYHQQHGRAVRPAPHGGGADLGRRSSPNRHPAVGVTRGAAGRNLQRGGVSCRRVVICDNCASRR